MVDLIKQEIAKALKGAAQSSKEGNSSVHTTEHAGTICFPEIRPELKGSWIIDPGASSHICTNNELFDELVNLATPISVNLPNGNTIRVTKIGTVVFNRLMLTETLFIPSFSHNLLSVNKITLINAVSCTFFPKFCLLQDQKNEKVLAVRRVVDSLYYLEQVSFSSGVLKCFNGSDSLQQCIRSSSLHHFTPLSQVYNVTFNNEKHT